MTSLPDLLDGQENAGRSEYAASWGDPRIVLRCGVATPAAYRPESELVVVDDVSWLAEEQESGYTFTAVGRTPQVEVYVPSTYAPEVNPLVDLAEAITAGTRVTGVAGATP